MGWHSLNQRLDRVNSNGPADLQPGGLAVSALLQLMVNRKLTKASTDLHGALR